MVCSALRATPLKLSLNSFSSCAAVRSVSSRSASSRCWSRAVKSLRFEVMLVQRSLQPPPLAVVRIPDGQVALALARHLKAGFLQGGDDVGAAPHGAVLDALRQVVPDQLAGVGLVLQAGPQLRRLDVGAMAGLLRPRPRRVIRPAPWVFR